ncbi:TIGR03960 family B12-binding radical SAM protein [Chloroflexota bacterium]
MIPDNILQQVTRPARYTGGEWNSVVKDWETTDIRIALSYPDSYEIGMSNAAIPILYELLNNQPDVLAERVYAPWVDMETIMRAQGIPLFSLESQHPLKQFDIIGFSLGYELTYTNVLNMLDLAGIPVLASDRDESHPLIIAGGSCALNPEPMSDFIDVFVIGDGEEVTVELLDCIRDWKSRGKPPGKEQLRHNLAAIPGIYVPSLYRVEYHADGTFQSITPTADAAKPSIRRRMVNELPPPVTKPVVPFIEPIHDRGAIEIQRGCSCGCRFCQAGMIYRPVRERPHQEVLRAAGELISNCGYNEVSLVSLNTSDYAGIDELVTRLSHDYPHLTLSLPSLRLDDFSVRLLCSLPSRNKTGLTFAPEAGSQRLQHVINKNITEDSLLETAATAFARGWTGLKLYFMVGLPTETLEDVEGIIGLVDKVRAAGRKADGRKPQLRISIATFVPKPHTPFQWVAQEKEPQLNAKHEILKSGLQRKGTRLSWNDHKVSLLEAALSRGDRRLGQVIHNAWKLGSTFDAWTEHFDYGNWLRAFAEAGLDPGFYAHRQRPLDESLPWAHIDVGVTDTFLKEEYQRALAETETPDCRHHTCNTCGVQQQPACQQKAGPG